MASVAENKQFYSGYNWALGGHEWSQQWGSTDKLWHESLVPRLSSYLPANRIIEIGSGYGRISTHLASHAEQHLYLFDIIEQCVDSCRRRFENSPNISCAVSDGVSLPKVADASIDLIVSFYSLVHADRSTIQSYLQECARTLSDDGVIFLHHSNAGAYYRPDLARSDDRQRLLARYRDTSMSADLMRDMADNSQLHCIHQECVNWDVEEILSDCFSTLTRPKSVHDRPHRLMLNRYFREEMRHAKLMWKDLKSFSPYRLLPTMFV